MSIPSPQQAAIRQAKSIEAFWAKRGRPDVKCVVVVDTDESGHPVFGVRSNISLVSQNPAPSSARRR